jgi:hypothetical protein
MLLTDQQIAFFGLCWLMILGVAAISDGQLTRRVIAFVTAAAVLPLVPAFWLYGLPLTRIAGYTTPGASEALRYSLPVTMLWTPGLIWRVYGALLPTALIVAVTRLRCDRSLKLWLLASIGFVILTFGPATASGHVPLPFALFRVLPIFKQFRTPYRFQIPAAIGLAVLAAIVFARATDAAGAPVRRALLLGATALAVADVLLYRVAFPMLIQSMPREPVYDAIAMDSRDRVILEVPFGVRTGTDRIGEGEIFTYYQPRHGKRLLNGFAARGPLAALAHYRESPALMFLAHEVQPPGDVLADLHQQLRDLDVGYLVVHTDRMTPSWRRQVLALVAELDNLTPMATGRAETVAFRID